MVAVVVVRVHHEGQGYLKYQIDLTRIRVIAGRGFDEGHDGRDSESGPCRVPANLSKNVHVLMWQPHLLMGLAQCRSSRIAIGRVDLSTGKSDLRRVGRNVCTALRQQQGWLLAQHQSDQNSRLTPRFNVLPLQLLHHVGLPIK